MELERKLEMLNDESSLADIQNYMNEAIRKRGFQDETEKDILLFLTEELGELAHAVRKKTNMKMDVDKSNDSDIKREIADIFSYILAMCRVLDIDLLQAFKDKESKNCKRKWQ